MTWDRVAVVYACTASCYAGIGCIAASAERLEYINTSDRLHVPPYDRCKAAKDCHTEASDPHNLGSISATTVA